MGLLENRNPRATRKSVWLWAFGGALVGGLIGVIGWLRADMPQWMLYWVLPWMIVWCGTAGGAWEWQREALGIDDLDEPENEAKESHYGD